MPGPWFHAFTPLVLVVAVTAQAQQSETEWLDSPAARQFRMRVAQLAVIYGDSRGVDPHGLLVTGRRMEPLQPDCADVDIVVHLGKHEPLHERLRACRHGEQ
jgi:hypothetical protein